jgi:hypothetical protein
LQYDSIGDKNHNSYPLTIDELICFQIPLKWLTTKSIDPPNTLTNENFDLLNFSLISDSAHYPHQGVNFRLQFSLAFFESDAM